MKSAKDVEGPSMPGCARQLKSSAGWVMRKFAGGPV